MKRIFIVLCFGLGATPQARAFSFDLAPNLCDKKPVLSDGLNNPHFTFQRFLDTPRYLSAVGDELLSHHRDFLRGLATELLSQSEGEILSAFTMNALISFFDKIPDPRLSAGVFPATKENLQCLNQRFEIVGIESFQEIAIVERLAVRILSHNLATSQSVLWKYEAEQAAWHAKILREFLEKSDDGGWGQHLRTYHSSLRDLAAKMEKSSFLAGRGTVNLRLLEFLAGRG